MTLEIRRLGRAVFQLFFTALLWGFSYGVNGWALEFMTACQMSLFFCALGALIFLPFAGHLSVRGLRFPCMAVGAIQLGIMYFFYQSAFNDLPSHQVALLSLTTPIYVGLFGDLWERRSPWLGLALAVGAVAISAVAVGGSLAGGVPIRGLVECQMANVSYGLGQVAYARLRRKNPSLVDRSALFWMYLGALLPIAMALFLPLAPPARAFLWTARQLGILLFLGIFCCGLGNYLWNRGAARVSTGILLISNNLPVIFGLLFGALFFGGTTNWPRQICGLVGLLGLLWLYARVGHGQGGTGNGPTEGRKSRAEHRA